MKASSIVLVAFAPVLVGCASSGMYGDLRTEPCLGGYVDERKLLSELESATPCCADYSHMTFVPAVVTDENHGHAIHKASPVFLFPSGKSRFIALALPPNQKANLFVQPHKAGRTSTATSCGDIKSGVLVGDGSEWYRAIEPVVTFLDAGKKPLAAAVPARSPESGDYRHAIPPGAAYAVIHTLPERLEAKRRIFQKSINQTLALLPVGTLNIPTPTSLAAVVTGTGVVVLRYED